jgi:hypothetical protein
MTKIGTGRIGESPQRTPRNPSQTNGGNFQGPRPPADASHISPEVRADLGKLTPELAAGVRRVADTK